MSYRKIITTFLALTLIALLIAAWVFVPQLRTIPDDVTAESVVQKPIFCKYVDPAIHFNIKEPWRAAAWLRTRWRYQSPVPYRWLRPEEALTLKKGYCIDYANLLCSDLRHFGLDAWVVVGTVPTYSLEEKHAWVECAYGKHPWYMDSFHNYIVLPSDWKELYRYNEMTLRGKA